MKSDARKGWGKATVDSLSRVSVRSLTTSATQMPDVHGMGLKDALFLLESRGLRVRFTGSGAVTSQSIPAGQTIRSGTTVTIELRN